MIFKSAGYLSQRNEGKYSHDVFACCLCDGRVVPLRLRQPPFASADGEVEADCGAGLYWARREDVRLQASYGEDLLKLCPVLQLRAQLDTIRRHLASVERYQIEANSNKIKRIEAPNRRGKLTQSHLLL